MGTIASQITSLTIVYSTVYSDADQRKHQSSASLAFVRRIHRGPVNSPHKWSVTQKMFPFDDVIMALGQSHYTSASEAILNEWISRMKMHQMNVNASNEFRVDSRLAPSQWETALLCNDVSHWLGTSLKSWNLLRTFNVAKTKQSIPEPCASQWRHITVTSPQIAGNSIVFPKSCSGNNKSNNKASHCCLVVWGVLQKLPFTKCQWYGKWLHAAASSCINGINHRLPWFSAEIWRQPQHYILLSSGEEFWSQRFLNGADIWHGHLDIFEPGSRNISYAGG